MTIQDQEVGSVEVTCAQCLHVFTEPQLKTFVDDLGRTGLGQLTMYRPMEAQKKLRKDVNMVIVQESPCNKDQQ